MLGRVYEWLNDMTNGIAYCQTEVSNWEIEGRTEFLWGKTEGRILGVIGGGGGGPGSSYNLLRIDTSGGLLGTWR